MPKSKFDLESIRPDQYFISERKKRLKIERQFGDMSSEPTPEPDQTGIVIYVGQDQAGHWLVQDSGRKLEGRFVSYNAAMSYAKAEREIYHASVEVTSAPLLPLFPFTPVGSDEHALRRAA